MNLHTHRKSNVHQTDRVKHEEVSRTALRSQESQHIADAKTIRWKFNFTFCLSVSCALHHCTADAELRLCTQRCCCSNATSVRKRMFIAASRPQWKWLHGERRTIVWRNLRIFREAASLCYTQDTDKTTMMPARAASIYKNGIVWTTARLWANA